MAAKADPAVRSATGNEWIVMMSLHRFHMFMLLVLVAFIPGVAAAQRTCGTMEYLQLQQALNPELKDRMDLIEAESQQWIDAQKGIMPVTQIITIPVVVHVVYNNSAENISEAQILSQINVLNEDFRRLNADATNTPNWFQAVVADCEIEFCLAQRDLSGNPTNGITRTATSHGAFSNDDVKSDATGGKDAWDRDNVLNIWVCNLSGLLGYATFPGGLAALDGVVIDYQAFGTTGTATAPFNLGRTATHEIGHWLNLYHTFEDGCAGATPATCASAGDYVCDTPPTASANYYCPGPQNTCTETPTNEYDMTMNYMDYTDDPCMYMFTAGQKTRMRAALDGARSSIQTSVYCNSVSPGTLQFNSSTYSVNENAISVTLSVSRTGGSSGVASVQYATADGSAAAGSDYTSASGPLTWSAGESADKTITVWISNDSSVESNETFTVTLSSASGASLGSDSAAVIIRDDDQSGQVVCNDYDGDGFADPAIYDEVTGTWKVKLSSAGYGIITTLNGLGGPGYAAVSADYDGDGLADPAVYGEATGQWTILLSSANYAVQVIPQLLGGPGYSGMPADYDGDRKAGPGVYQRERGDWKIMLSLENYSIIELPGLLGGTGYRAVAADYDGDRKADPAVYGESTGIWSFLLSSAGYASLVIAQTLGGSGYVPVPADYDGDGLADPAVKSATGNEWIVMLSSGGYTAVPLTIQFYP